MRKKETFRFGLSVETNSVTGKVMAVYFKIREGASYKVKEFDHGNVFADYDRKGRLLGIEMLGPCEVKVLNRIAENASVKKFVKAAIPQGMLCAS